jgi:hypothetical protein
MEGIVLSQQRSFSDSPWFWAYLFTVAALISLALIGPKYSRRQAQLERQFEGRQGTVGIEPALPDRAVPPRISLQPLYFGLAILTVIVWLLHWRRSGWKVSGQRSDVGDQTSEIRKAKTQ